jgi:hypothetical protein
VGATSLIGPVRHSDKQIFGSRINGGLNGELVGMSFDRTADRQNGDGEVVRSGDEGLREAPETLMLMPSTTSGGGMKAVRARPRTMQKRLGGFAKLRSMEALLL